MTEFLNTDSHASSSHEVSLEPTPARSADLGKHSVYTHFPNDRNCEICQRTKITRSPCRRRNGEAVPRAENFGDLITADHKVFSDTCESRNNHWYAVVVQDLATQWIQSYSCKTKTSQETQMSLQKFLEPNRKPKVINTDNSLEFVKDCEDLSWNHWTSTPHRSETNGIAERAVRRVKEGTSAVLLQSEVWMKIGGRILWNAKPICETFKISCLMGKLHTRDVLGNHFKDRSFRLVHWLSITLFLRKTWIVPWIRSVRGVNLEGWHKKEEEPGCPKTVQVAVTWYGDDSPHLSWKCAQETGKAGENGQHSGEVGGSSLKSLVSDQRPIQGGDRPRRRLRGRYRLGVRPVVLFRTETALCTVGPT